MRRFANLTWSGRSILVGMMLAATIACWGCGGKEPAPPPGAENQPVKAPEVTLPGIENTTPTPDNENK